MSESQFLDAVIELRRRRFEIEDIDDAHAALTAVAPNFDAELQLEELNRALERLPPTQREALLLVCADGLPYGHAADVCGVAIGTIKSRISRARAQLVHQLGELAAMNAHAPLLDANLSAEHSSTVPRSVASDHDSCWSRAIA